MSASLYVCMCVCVYVSVCMCLSVCRACYSVQYIGQLSIGQVRAVNHVTWCVCGGGGLRYHVAMLSLS